MKSFQITEYCHRIIQENYESAALCIDATAGNGGDTLFLCRLSGEKGKVLAFDIQDEALKNTAELLESEGVSERARLILDSHENMGSYINEDRGKPAEDCVDIIMFNFGYLPGGDHSIATRAESSVRAIGEGIRLLKKGGIMNLCIYSGGDSGYEEREAILEYIKGLDPKKYVVITHEFFNRPNDPPLPVLIKRMK